MYMGPNGARPISLVLAGAGVDLTGWTLDEVTAISDDGQTIVGSGTNPNGDTEAWMAVIPEPSSGALLAFGLVAVAIRKHAKPNATCS